MASSGWQGEKTIYAGDYNHPKLIGDVEIYSITHSGTNLKITGQVQTINPAGSCIGFNGAEIWCSGSWSTTRNLNKDCATQWNERKTWENYFDVTIGGVGVSDTSYTFRMGVDLPGLETGGSVSWTLYFDASSTPPSAPSVSLVDYGQDWADIAVSISSWGTPSGSASRYIEAAVLETSSYRDPYKAKKLYAQMSGTIHVANNSYDFGSITITPNTQYSYGGYVTNTAQTANTVGGQFTTLPAVPVINAIDQGHGVIDVTVTHAAEGSALTVTEEYSTDGGTTWTTITGGAFTVTISTQTVLTVRRSSTAGASSGTVTVTPSFTTAIYGSVLNKTVEVKHIYASVNGVTKKVKKVYASVGGKTKLVFEDVS